MKKLYTIGHSNTPLDSFLHVLYLYKITQVFDVRSIPRSRFVPQFNEKAFSNYLNDKGISYCNMGQFFGARIMDANYEHPDGYPDFARFRESPLFQEGMKQTLNTLKHDNVVLMCTEKDPLDCHRAIMVARGFEQIGIPVTHILHDGSSLSQEELNERLLARYFPDSQQISLFDANETRQEQLSAAYQKRNSEIGYRRKQK